MTRISRRTALRCVEAACFAVGLACLGWVGFVHVDAARYDRALRVEASARPTAPPAQRADVLNTARTLSGWLEIPRLQFSAAVAEGDDDATLRIAIGHLPDTALPWQVGNTALAGHRDGMFRPLAGIRAGDVLRLKTPQGDFDYRVRDTLIVNPDDVWVLEPTGGRELTLVTCYPFAFIGHAPQRFIVRADGVASAAE